MAWKGRWPPTTRAGSPPLCSSSTTYPTKCETLAPRCNPTGPLSTPASDTPIRRRTTFPICSCPTRRRTFRTWSIRHGAFNYARRREFDHALPCYAAVARVDPFDVPNLLHWGETLRRKEHWNDAADMLQAALNRLPATLSPYVEAQGEYIAYERRLSQIESGREADLRHDLDQHLNAPAPSGIG